MDATRAVVPRSGSVVEDGRDSTAKAKPREAGTVAVAQKPQPLETGVPAHLKRQAKYYRAVYVLVGLGVLYAAESTPHTVLQDEDNNAVWWRLHVLVWVAVVSYFALQGSDPGFLDLDPQQEQLLDKQPGATSDSGRLHTVELVSPKDLDEDELQLHVSGSAASSAASSASSSASASGDSDSDPDSDTDEEDDDAFELDIEPDEAHDAELANVSRSIVPMRAKFCRNSKRYVATFDHFCGVLGTCIGERNHCKFWWFLFWHTLSLVYLQHIVQTGFRDTVAEVGTWFDYNAHAVMATIMLSLLLLSAGGLLLFHSFLACASLTSYEFLRAEKISYLEGTRDFDLPFSHGLRSNLKRFCVLDGLMLCCVRRPDWQPRRWALPERFERDSEDVWNNLWENKYWSCC